MSSRFCASIRIGGQIRRSKVELLLKEIRAAALSLEWGDAPFLPQNADELMGGEATNICGSATSRPTTASFRNWKPPAANSDCPTVGTLRHRLIATPSWRTGVRG